MTFEHPDKTWLVELVKRVGLVTRPGAPFTLASGATSIHYLDGKRVLACGRDLLRVAGMALDQVPEPFDAVGGLTMGADALAVGVACAASLRGAEVRWFSVRKEPKDHGLAGRWVVGADLGECRRLLLVDDVVTTGGSTIRAIDAIRSDHPETEIVAAVCLVDRGGGARERLAELGIEYRPLLTCDDLGIPPVG
ncbi:MAG: orotate phosphoribosyltransferase [Acidimicrobiales bacterium]|nr:MAG: orotate phosphoribosyltransferase [Acidimicrobiales bacterium]